jgi:MoxR-like ATPase
MKSIRAPAKTQSSLFEVMEEKQVSVDGNTYKMQLPFMVVATQNPVEQEGTYRLPEAQLDRFLFKINVPYPSLDEEFLY